MVHNSKCLPFTEISTIYIVLLCKNKLNPVMSLNLNFSKFLLVELKFKLSPRLKPIKYIYLSKLQN